MKLYDVRDADEIILRDYLARDRTMLAVERTMLAYMRTAIGCFSAGAAGIKLITDAPVISAICVVLLAVSPLFIAAGIFRTVQYSARVRSIPDNDLMRGKNENEHAAAALVKK